MWGRKIFRTTAFACALFVAALSCGQALAGQAAGPPAQQTDSGASPAADTGKVDQRIVVLPATAPTVRLVAPTMRPRIVVMPATVQPQADQSWFKLRIEILFRKIEKLKLEIAQLKKKTPDAPPAPWPWYLLWPAWLLGILLTTLLVAALIGLVQCIVRAARRARRREALVRYPIHNSKEAERVDPQFAPFVAAKGVEIIPIRGGRLWAHMAYSDVLAQRPDSGAPLWTRCRRSIEHMWSRVVQRPIEPPKAAEPRAALSVTVRDMSASPSMDRIGVDAAQFGGVAPTRKGDQGGKAAAGASLRRYMSSQPEIAPATMQRSYVDGDRLQTTTITFPRVMIDITGSPLAFGVDERFDYLAASITIHPGPLRFVNFTPKEADLFAFTTAQLKTTSSATGNASAGVKPTGTGTAKINAPEATLGIAMTNSQEISRELKSALEARSAGIYDDGQTFLVELRSNEQRRIAGTYSFEMMLEYDPTPVADRQDEDDLACHATFTIVGVERHAIKAGTRGFLHSVPEPEMDDVLREAIVTTGTLCLWEPPEDVADDTRNHNLAIVMNEPDGRYSVSQQIDGEMEWRVIDWGEGPEGSTRVFPDKEARIDFMPINRDESTLEAPSVTVTLLSRAPPYTSPDAAFVAEDAFEDFRVVVGQYRRREAH
jgi:hypothetical protein